MVGLHYLKNAYDESDESCVERFLENPYWQYFWGVEYFQHEVPLKPTTLVKWRQRIGEGGIEKLFYQTLITAQKLGLLTKSHLNIEPIIGHLKSNNRMDRNYLKGTVGDKINALLCGCGAYIRKLIAAFFLSLEFLTKLYQKVLDYLMIAATKIPLSYPLPS